MKHPITDPNVSAVFGGYARGVQGDLLWLRDLILDTAADLPRVGRVEETLKWGQPAYLTPDTKSGTTIRIGANKVGGFAIYTHCQTTLMGDHQAIFDGQFTYEGNRAIHFGVGDDLPVVPLKQLITAALTYHLNKKGA